jgi:hypothetical protein
MQLGFGQSADESGGFHAVTVQGTGRRQQRGGAEPLLS